MSDLEVEIDEALATWSDGPLTELLRRARCALSQQDEQYPPCDFCGVIPGHHPWHGSGLFNGVDSPHIHACNGCRHLLPVNPAQTEQQPSTTQQILDLIMEQCRYWHGRDEARRGGFACLYTEAKAVADATPIAQTAPSCNHRFMYFGDQTKRRCADCCVVEGNEQTAPAQDEQQPVATILPPDPLDERDGISLSYADIRRLAALPAGTKLYTDPQRQDSDCSLSEGG